MNETVKIVLLHLLILATQALYMYLSNKSRFKQTRALFLIAVPLVSAFPALLNMREPYSCSLYEYSVIFCVFTAALADVILAAGYGREHITEVSGRRFMYAYLIICAASALIGSAGAGMVLLTAIVFAAVIFYQCFAMRHSVTELFNAIPLSAFSLVCSLVFLQYIL